LFIRTVTNSRKKSQEDFSPQNEQDEKFRAKSVSSEDESNIDPTFKSIFPLLIENYFYFQVKN